MENRVFIIGDSQTKYLHKYFSTLMNYRVTLNAASGRRIQDVPPSLLSECGKYSHIILHLGTNNVSGEDNSHKAFLLKLRNLMNSNVLIKEIHIKPISALKTNYSVKLDTKIKKESMIKSINGGEIGAGCLWRGKAGLSSASAAICRLHRSDYLLQCLTRAVLSDGASIQLRYHEPKQIITLPLDLSTLSETEAKARLERRRPKTKVKIQEENLTSFDAKKYIKYIKKK